MEMSGQLHDPVALPPGREYPVSIGVEAGWAPEPVWMLWGREKPLASAGNRTPVVQPQPVCIPTGLSRIHYLIIIPFKKLIIK
jgi:hypothetical protein